MNRGAWRATVPGIVKSQTQLSYFHCHRLNSVHAYYLIQSSHFVANRWGNNGNSERLYFLEFQNHCRWVTAAKKLKDTCSLEEKL